MGNKVNCQIGAEYGIHVNQTLMYDFNNLLNNVFYVV